MSTSGELDLLPVRGGSTPAAVGVDGRPQPSADGTSFAVWAPNAREVEVVGDWSGWVGRDVARAQRRLRRLDRRGARGEGGPGLQVPDPDARRRERARAPILRDGGPRSRRRRRAGSRRRPATRGRRATGRRIAAPATTAGCRSTRSTSDRGAGIPTASRTPTASGGSAGRARRRARASPTSSSCRSPPIPSADRGATRSPATTRPTPARATPTTCAPSIDTLHDAGLGVIVDWVPGHFPRDDGALARFDGTALYEHADPAPRRASRLGHLRVQLRTPRGRELPRRQRPLLVGGVPRRRAARRRRRLDAVPRLQPRGGGVGAQRARRPRGPRRHRVPPRAQRRRRRGAPGRPGDRGGVDGVARRHRAHRERRPGVLTQVEPRLDARHARRTSRTIPSTAATTTAS